MHVWIYSQDGLLSAGYGELITRIYKQIPQVTGDGKRLQMIVCSATLHSIDVRRLAVSFCRSSFVRYFIIVGLSMEFRNLMRTVTGFIVENLNIYQ